MYCLKFNLIISKNLFFEKKISEFKNKKKVFMVKFSYKNIFSFQFFKKDILFNFLYKNNNIYIFSDKLNSVYLHRFFKTLNFIFYNNHKILFVDSSSDFILPFYNYLYGFHDIRNSKEFFFLDKSRMTFNNWIYFYKNFLIKKKISCLIILDYNYFNKFIRVFSRLRVYLFSFFSSRFSNLNIDFFFFINNKYYNFTKLIIFNNIINLFFKNYNINQFFFKNKFFKKFNEIKKID